MIRRTFIASAALVAVLAISGPSDSYAAQPAQVGVFDGRVILFASQDLGGDNFVASGSSSEVVLSSSANPVEALDGCSNISPSRVSCAPVSGALTGADVLYSSSDDSFQGTDLTLPVTAQGGGGNDVLIGKETDQYFGGGGDDTLSAGAVLGENGNDTLTGETYMLGGPGADTFDGGPVDYRSELSARNADLATPLNLTLDGVSNDGPAGERDNLGSHVATILSGDGNDYIDASGFEPSAGVAPPNWWSEFFAFGGGGDDQIYGSAYPDTLTGGGGADDLFGGLAADHFQANDGEADQIACDFEDPIVADRFDEFDRLSCHPAPLFAPVVEQVSQNTFLEGDVIEISGRNFCGGPDLGGSNSISLPGTVVSESRTLIYFQVGARPRTIDPSPRVPLSVQCAGQSSEVGPAVAFDNIAPIARMKVKRTAADPRLFRITAARSIDPDGKLASHVHGGPGSFRWSLNGVPFSKNLSRRMGTRGRGKMISIKFPGNSTKSYVLRLVIRDGDGALSKPRSVTLRPGKPKPSR